MNYVVWTACLRGKCCMLAKPNIDAGTWHMTVWPHIPCIVWWRQTTKNVIKLSRFLIVTTSSWVDWSSWTRYHWLCNHPAFGWPYFTCFHSQAWTILAILIWKDPTFSESVWVLNAGFNAICNLWHLRHCNLFPCDKIRMWQQQIIKIIIPFWTEKITIRGFKLLFWLFLAVEISHGIICRHLAKSKNELMTESEYFTRQM
jgi:hypothetical protein